ncbi:MAG: iron ABC transporter permease [Acidimicrobiia bacterium]|nr:iron ABC transporter permease [Acidimicrobiia bacterium]
MTAVSAPAEEAGLPAPPPATVSPARRTPAMLWVASTLVAVVFAAPLGYLVWKNLGNAGDYLDILSDEGAFAPARRSLLLASTVASTSAVLGTTLAWLLIRSDLPGRRTFSVLAALPLVVPSFVGALALLAAFAPGGLFDIGIGRPKGFTGAFVVLTLFTYPYVYLLAAARFASLPATLEEAARTLGRSPASVFRTVVLPQSRGAIAAGTLLVFLYTLSDFGAVSLLRYDTLTTRIFSSRLLDQPASLAMSLLLAVIALVVVTAERRVQRRRIHVEAVSAGRASARASLGLWKIPALLFVVSVVAVALVAPVVVLGQWVLRGLLDHELALVDVFQPAWNTVWISVVAGAVATSVVLPIAYLTTRYRSRFAGTYDVMVVSGFALPGLVIALAIVFWVVNAPILNSLYLSFPLLVIAYVVNFGSQALRAGQVAVSGSPTGSTTRRRCWAPDVLAESCRSTCPSCDRGLAAGTGLVVLSTMKELPATLLLAPIGFQTLATRIFDRTEDLFYAEAGLAALVLVALSGLLTWLLTIRRMDTLS